MQETKRSGMGKDQFWNLIEKAKEINAEASKREMDMLLTAGEQISISLLAMAIEKLGFPVVSLLGWQAGFKTNSTYSSARIKRVDPERIKAALDKRKIVVVAGFQGMNRYDDITTLGRGGSDTSAVALAAELIDSGRAAAVLDRLAEVSNRPEVSA